VPPRHRPLEATRPSAQRVALSRFAGACAARTTWPTTIDIVVTPEGEHVFLEVNLAGEFFWLEISPGFPVSEEIADVLLGHAARREHDLPTIERQTHSLSSLRPWRTASRYCC